MVKAGATVGEIRQGAREDAEQLLERLWDRRLPVDPVAFARDLGVSVFDAQLGDDTWGMIIGSSEGADIYLDKDQPENRYRFSCAHELGHYVDNAATLEPGKGYADRRSDKNHGRAEEIYANEFAASLLMPELMFRDRVKQGASDLDLVREFAVSLNAVRLRKMHLGL